ncbi:MAG: hypothetical protein H5T63_05395 [Chloroflexi bacterium]|nr:hypothetical protein [Chloroflexota bacterium]
MAVRLLDLEGSPYDIGYQHGRELQEAIQELCEERLRLLRTPCGAEVELDLEDVLEIGRQSWVWHEEYDPDLTRELLGIADGAEVDPIELLLMNGYTDFIDIAQKLVSGQDECTAFWVGRDVAQGNMAYVGQTWDMDVSACPYVVALRLWPEEGPAALLLSVSGCLGLAGINEAGVAVVINNLTPRDARPGVNFVFLVRKALKQVNLEGAVRSLVDVNRLSGHNYLVADSSGRAVNVETSATEVSVTLLQKGSYVHTNHYLSQKLCALERQQGADEDSPSKARRRRMQALLADRSSPLDPVALQVFLADHGTGADAICRHASSPSDSATCGAAIMSPQEGKMWVAQGNPCLSGYELLQL